MMKFSIITPTYDARRMNLILMESNLHIQVDEWHLIHAINDNSDAYQPYSATAHWPDSLGCQQSETEVLCYAKINWWLDRFCRPDGNRFLHFLCDDDCVSPTFYGEVSSTGKTAPIIIPSMMRGHNSEGMRHECSTLVAAPENMKVGKVGLEQIIILESVMSRYRLDLRDGCADGRLIERIVTENPNDVVYRPDVAVWFNFYEPGRWKRSLRS